MTVSPFSERPYEYLYTNKIFPFFIGIMAIVEKSFAIVFFSTKKCEQIFFA